MTENPHFSAQTLPHVAHAHWRTRNWTAQQSEEQLWRLFRETADKKMQLHFTKEVLPDSVSSDFQNLNKFNEQVNTAGFPRETRAETASISY